MIALIPARAGSRRIPGKNTKPLGGKPLIRWTIEAAKESECFDRIYVCTDDDTCILEALGHPLDETWNVEPIPRPPVPDDQRDIDWIVPVLNAIPAEDFAILRPTSPFRGPDTIRRAVHQWWDCKDRVDSLRAMRRTTETGWKQWVIEDVVPGPCSPSCACSDTHTMRPLTTAAAKKHLHSFPTQSLEDTYIQTAGLEIAHTKTVLELGTIAGEQVGMFLVEGPEALDLNTPEDWERAEVTALSLAQDRL